MPTSLRLLGRFRWSVVLVPLAAAGAWACSWNLDYLEAGGTDAGTASDARAVSDSGAADTSVPAESSTSDAAPAADTGTADAGTPYLGDGGNLMKNPSCEHNVINWSTLSATPIESSTAYVHTGNQHSCRSYDLVDKSNNGSDPSSYDGPMQDITSVIVPGHEYTVSAWVLWAPPPGGSPEAGATAANDAGVDGSLADGGDTQDGAPAAEAGPVTYDPQNVYITVKQTCGTTTTYNRLTTLAALPQAQWGQIVTTSTPLQVPDPCANMDFQLYFEGPDIGLDLYLDEATLTLVN